MYSGGQLLLPRSVTSWKKKKSEARSPTRKCRLLKGAQLVVHWSVSAVSQMSP